MRWSGARFNGGTYDLPCCSPPASVMRMYSESVVFWCGFGFCDSRFLLILLWIFSRYINASVEICSMIWFLGQVSCLCAFVFCSLISMVFSFLVCMLVQMSVRVKLGLVLVILTILLRQQSMPRGLLSSMRAVFRPCLVFKYCISRFFVETINMRGILFLRAMCIEAYKFTDPVVWFRFGFGECDGM